MDQFTNFTLGKKIARNGVLGCFVLAMDAIFSFCTQDRTYEKHIIIFAVGYVSCRISKSKV